MAGLLHTHSDDSTDEHALARSSSARGHDHADTETFDATGSRSVSDAVLGSALARYAPLPRFGLVPFW